MWKVDLERVRCGGGELSSRTAVVVWTRVVMGGRGCDWGLTWRFGMARIWSLIGCWG